MKQNEAHSIDPITISIPILFWITAFIESCLHFITGINCLHDFKQKEIFISCI